MVATTNTPGDIPWSCGAMSLQKAVASGAHQFCCGVTASISGCYDFWTSHRQSQQRYTTSNLRALLISILVTSFVCGILLIPVHLLFYLARLIIFLAKPEWNQPAAAVHSHITFYNLLFDACWYLPLIVLFLARLLGRSVRSLSSPEAAEARSRKATDENPKPSSLHL